MIPVTLDAIPVVGVTASGTNPKTRHHPIPRNERFLPPNLLKTRSSALILIPTWQFSLCLCPGEMSFFGFDTTLPRDKPSGDKRGIFENPDPFAEVARAGIEGTNDDDA